jgi:deoxyribonuclease-4
VAEPVSAPPGLRAGRPRIGAHVPVAGGFAAGLRYAADIGAEAIQVFVSNPRSWALPSGDPAGQAREAGAIRDWLAEAALPVFVHAPYLVNVGSADPVIRDRSVASIRHSLHRGGAIGARGVVVHTGSAAGGERDKGMLRARDSLLPVLDSIPAGGPDLLLEPTAGVGQLLCSSLADLGRYLEIIEWHPRAGVCLDTCHAFSAGADLAAPGGAAAALSELAGVLDGPAPAGARQRLQGPVRLPPGPPREHRRGPDRRAAVQRTAAPPGRRGPAVRDRDPWAEGGPRRRRRHAHPPARPLSGARYSW